ncbi:hypothetical protein F5X68DRAFT_33125 [Plectosphaerella plurivora]|uniref:Putative lipoate-protein ligase A n=1 Tax=Plectosphaerella plurivora TaxID=936078 RepID=A0A9P8V4K3_9PEZI|nr:hypothetical protein F5X68DRAFT_33125 [Plectosphaerella plurivora]
MLLLTRTSRATSPRAIFACARAISGLASASSASAKTQVYVSRSRDPYLNLSIEHHLLQKTPSDSTVLFLYTNRPCVVIGRNQNPWLEVNLPLLNSLARKTADETNDGPSSSFDSGVELVRRRSGGGTVFHDEGNMNFSVICPPSAFDRDKHAEMIVRALQSLGVGGARVNCRHDIVVDVPSESLTSSEKPPEPPSCRANAPPPEKDGQVSTFKVSGSAYKLTRLRSLHHGTCLLSSPNLRTLGKLLRSPAEPFIKGRGVDSVRSPVRNVGVMNDDFEKAVVAEFGKMYGDFDIETTVGENEASLDGIFKGLTELKSRDWIYGQTPLFTMSTHPTEEDERPRPPIPAQIQLRLDARHGVIQKLSVQSPNSAATTLDGLQDAKIYDIQDWNAALSKTQIDGLHATRVGTWLNQMLGTGGDVTQD